MECRSRQPERKINDWLSDVYSQVRIGSKMSCQKQAKRCKWPAGTKAVSLRPLEPRAHVDKLYSTFKNPVTIGVTDPDPHLMMPLAVGDYINFSGIDLGGLFAVYSLEAALGIYTSPGTKPAYVTVESAIYGVVQGAPNTEVSGIDLLLSLSNSKLF